MPAVKSPPNLYQTSKPPTQPAGVPVSIAAAATTPTSNQFSRSSPLSSACATPSQPKDRRLLGCPPTTTPSSIITPTRPSQLTIGREDKNDATTQPPSPPPQQLSNQGLLSVHVGHSTSAADATASAAVPTTCLPSPTNLISTLPFGSSSASNDVVQPTPSSVSPSSTSCGHVEKHDEPMTVHDDCEEYSAEIAGLGLTRQKKLRDDDQRSDTRGVQRNSRGGESLRGGGEY